RAQIDFVEYEHFEAFKRAYPTMRLFACTTKGQTCYTQPNFKPGDGFLFGPETRGLPESILETFLPEQRLRIPMREGSRSLNLSNSAAVVLYEAWRQVGFAVV